MELQSTMASPAAMLVAPIALLMASTSLTGPAMREVPVSAMASHPFWQIAKCWDPTLILKFVLSLITLFSRTTKVIFTNLINTRPS